MSNGAIPEATASELAARKHAGFSLHGSVRTAAQDRQALQRLLNYCTRPAIALDRLDYFPDRDRVRYRPKKVRPGDPALLEWPPLEFIRRFVPIIPPPYLNLVRYSGALGPRSHLRNLITQAARLQATETALLTGWKKPRLAAAHSTLAGLKTSAAQTWALCLKKVFEITPLLCTACGTEMEPIAVIINDAELVKILACLGLPTCFPILKHARAPPLNSPDTGAALPWSGSPAFYPQIDPQAQADHDQPDPMPGS